jgi:hypothetical protein
MEWKAVIELNNSERLMLSDHETGLWFALWKTGAHCSSPITREQAIAIRENLDEWLSRDVEHASV